MSEVLVTALISGGFRNFVPVGWGTNSRKMRGYAEPLPQMTAHGKEERIGRSLSSQKPRFGSCNRIRAKLWRGAALAYKVSALLRGFAFVGIIQFLISEIH